MIKRSTHTFPIGFKSGGTHCGIKKKGALDIGLVYSDKGCICSGVFTKNKFKAAPVIYSQKLLAKTSSIDAVIVNSGCANAVTGEQGLKNAERMADLVGINFKKKLKTVVMSTGVIGHHLKMDCIENGISSLSNKLGNDEASWTSCAKAFMTTDTRHKLITKKFKFQDKEYTMAGISKGAGMIHPNMATLLALVCTDVSVDKNILDDCMQYATQRSFNSISIDGDTSTNDTCFVMSNGESGCKITKDNYLEFRENLTGIMIELAQLIVKDAEGATKFVEVSVNNAENYEMAKEIAQTVATSTLVKTALFGQDANWGRIICAVGYSQNKDKVDPNKVNLSIHGKSTDNNSTVSIDLLKHGQPIEMDEDKALKVMQHQNIVININLNIGNENAKMWTCDLSHEYVTINGSYRS